MKRLVAGMLLAVLPTLASAQDDQAALIEASKAESGLLLYTTSGPSAWAPVFAKFNELYPWVKAEALDMGGTEVLERAKVESATGVRTADILIAGVLDRFILASDEGMFQPFTPAGIERYPAMARPLKDVYTYAPEPGMLVFNKVLLPENLWPTSLTDLADKVAANPAIFNGKVATFDPVNSNSGPGQNIPLARKFPDAYWSNFTKLAPALRFESGAGAMLDKVTSGEYVAAYFAGRFLVANQIAGARGKIVGMSYIPDSQPFQLRVLGITKTAASPATAKLFVNFLYTPEGQLASEKGGAMPFDPGLGKVEGVTTMQDVLEAIGGEEHAGFSWLDRTDLDYRAEFAERINKILGR